MIKQQKNPFPLKALLGELSHSLCKMFYALIYMNTTQINKEIAQILQRPMETSKEMLVDRIHYEKLKIIGMWSKYDKWKILFLTFVSTELTMVIEKH